MEQALQEYRSQTMMEGLIDMAMLLAPILFVKYKGVSDTVELFGTADSITSIGGSIAECYAIQRNITEASDKELARWLNVGGGCVIDGEEVLCFYGAYSPEVLRELMLIEDEGLAVAAGWNEKMINDKKSDIAELEEDKGERFVNLCYALLEGGFSFGTYSYVNENEEEVHVTPTELVDAIRALDAECDMESLG